MIATKSRLNCKTPATTYQNRTRSPYMNVFTEGDKYFFEFLLAGISKERLSISVEEDILRIEASEETEKETKELAYLRRVRLPKDADKSNIEANLENGILTVGISKKAKEVTTINIA